MRTEKGYIGKLKEQYTFGQGVSYPEPQEWVIDIGNGKEYIAKDIIDLIEENDIIATIYGLIVVYKIIKENNGKILINNEIELKDIKSILTHEQYENNAYRLEE